MNRIVSVTKRIKTLRGLRYCPVVISGNGRIKPDAVIVDDREERHPEGSYYLNWYAGKRLMRLSVGKDAATATARRQQKEAELNAKTNGIAVVPESSRRLVSVAVTGYLEDTELTKKPKTLAAYTTALDYFTQSCKKQYLEDIDRKDLLRFSALLRDEKEQAPRTCWNKFANVMSFLKANGVELKLRVDSDVVVQVDDSHSPLRTGWN